MKQNQSYYTTNDLSFAAACASVGVPFNPDPSFLKIRTNAGEHFKFLLGTKSTCGNYVTEKLNEFWNDDKFVEQNPEHPFAYIKAAFKNRDGLLDVVKQAKALIIIERNGRYAIISEGASKEKQEKLLSQL